MSVSVGIYELLGYTVPGSLYLALVAYLASRLDWPGVDQLASVDTTLVVLGVILLAYLLGMLFNPVGQFVYHRLRPQHVPVRERAAAQFCDQNPTLADRSFLELDHFTLLAGLRQHAPDTAATVDRFRATAHMLRSSCVAFVLASVVAVIEAVVGSDPGRAAVSAMVLAGAGAAAMLRAGTISAWAFTSALQGAVWLPEPDPVPPGGVGGE